MEWATTNDKVATVNNGKIVAVGAGTCVVTVTVSGTDVKDEVTVTVKETVVLVEKVEITGLSSVYVNKSQSYTCVVTPSNANYSEVKWSVSDTSVATIDQNGLLTALKEGTVTIKAKANELIDLLTSQYPEYVNEINQSGDITDAVEKIFTKTMLEFKQ